MPETGFLPTLSGAKPLRPIPASRAVRRPEEKPLRPPTATRTGTPSSPPSSRYTTSASEVVNYRPPTKTSNPYLLHPSQLPLSTSGAKIVDRLGNRVKLRCVNWSGAQLQQYVVGGLNVQKLDNIILAIHNLHFNCVRLVYSLDFAAEVRAPTDADHDNHNLPVLPDAEEALAANKELLYSGASELPSFDEHDGAEAESAWSSRARGRAGRGNKLSSTEAPPLKHPSKYLLHPYHELFKLVVQKLGEQKLLVILNNHMSDAGWCCSAYDGNGLWWTRSYSEEQWIEHLVNITAEFSLANPYVVGVDLRNEIRPAYISPIAGAGTNAAGNYFPQWFGGGARTASSLLEGSIFRSGLGPGSGGAAAALPFQPHARVQEDDVAGPPAEPSAEVSWSAFARALWPEPASTSTRDSSRTDWAPAALKAGLAVHETNPDLLIIVGGVYYNMFLCDVPKFPVHEFISREKNKVVYSSHAYSWFSNRLQIARVLRIYATSLVSLLFVAWGLFLLFAVVQRKFPRASLTRFVADWVLRDGSRRRRSERSGGAGEEEGELWSSDSTSEESESESGDRGGRSSEDLFSDGGLLTVTPRPGRRDEIADLTTQNAVTSRRHRHHRSRRPRSRPPRTSWCRRACCCCPDPRAARLRRTSERRNHFLRDPLYVGAMVSLAVLPMAAFAVTRFSGKCDLRREVASLIFVVVAAISATVSMVLWSIVICRYLLEDEDVRKRFLAMCQGGTTGAGPAETEAETPTTSRVFAEGGAEAAAGEFREQDHDKELKDVVGSSGREDHALSSGGVSSSLSTSSISSSTSRTSAGVSPVNSTRARPASEPRLRPLLSASEAFQFFVTPVRSRFSFVFAVSFSVVYAVFTYVENELQKYEYLEQEYDENWGFLVKQNIAPVWVGEFGTGDSSTSSWFKHFLRYVEANDLDWGYWPIDGQNRLAHSEPFGILDYDYTRVSTTDPEKIFMLAPGLNATEMTNATTGDVFVPGFGADSYPEIGAEGEL